MTDFTPSESLTDLYFLHEWYWRKLRVSWMAHRWPMT